MFALVAAGSIDVLRAGPAQQRGSDERGIYSAVLGHLFSAGVPPRIVVETVPVAMAALSESDLQRLDRAAAGMRTTDQTPFTVEMFPPGTTLVARETILELILYAPRGPGLDDHWRSFRTRFNVQTYQAFSRPVLSADGLSALVWFRHSCGSLCGTGGYAWLQRATVTSDWVFVKSLVKLMS
jgi:hypothetical protein